jgi:hypothetical protein
MTVLLAAAWLAVDMAEARDFEVQVAVMTSEGAPLRAAEVWFADDADAFPVNAETGTAAATIAYVADGGELVFVPGTVLDLTVSAPGYRTESFQHVVARRGLFSGSKANRITVTAQPLVLPRPTCLPADAPWPATAGEAPAVETAVGVDAQRCSRELVSLAAYQAWSDAAAVNAQEPSRAALEMAETARSLAIATARGAMDWAGAAGVRLEIVPALCLSMTGHAEDCVR